MTNSSTGRVVWPLGIGTALSLLGDITLYTVLPTHTADAGVLLASVGILLSANRIVRLGSNGVVGWLCDRWSRRLVFLIALLLGSVSTAIYAFTVGFWPLLLGRLLWGISWSGIWIAGNGMVLTAAEPAQRGRWVGFYHVSFFLGAAVGAFLGGFLTDWLGYRPALWVAAGASLAGTVIAWLSLPRKIEERRLKIEDWELPASNPPQETVNLPTRRAGELATAMALLGVHRLVIAGVFVSTLGLFLFDVVGESAVLWQRRVGVATLTGIGLGSSTLLSMLLTPAMGSLSDWTANRWRVVAAGLVPGAVGFMLLAWGAPLAVVAAIGLTAVAGSSSQNLSTTLVGDVTPARQRGRVLGVLYTVGDFASAIGPLLAFALIPWWGTRGLYVACAGLLAAMTLAAVYWAFQGTAVKQRTAPL